MVKTIRRIAAKAHRGPKPRFQYEIVKKFQGKEFTTHDVMRKTHHSYQSVRSALNRLIEGGMVVFTGEFIPTGGRPEQVLKIDMRRARTLAKAV